MKMEIKIQKISEGILKNFPSYHGWPTVTYTDDGRLIAVCSGNRIRHVCPYGRVWMYISEDEGKTWKGPKALSSGPLDDRDAGIIQASDKSLLINYFTSTLSIFRPNRLSRKRREIAESINLVTLRNEHGFWMRRSTDGGKTWSKKYRTPVYSPHGPTRMKDGTLFFPGQRQGSLNSGINSTQEFCAAFSNDNGLSWQIKSVIPMPAGHDIRTLFEPHGIEAPDGSLVVQYRNHYNDLNETWQCESADGGKSWSEPHSVCKGFPSHLQRFGKDQVIMSYGIRTAPYGVRARISNDSCKTWSNEIVISDDGLSWDLGYPSTVEMPDGSFFTLWYEKRRLKEAKLRFCRWKLAEKD